ncbi:MAG TPA: HEAT repeat domain-containing protein [Pirellulales bacterium]|jgi:HEAT repeat protein|nr:HEAT repeat domain-containing protein [Pirellulales bacterium]
MKPSSFAQSSRFLRPRGLLLLGIASLASALALSGRSLAADDPADQLVPIVINLITDKDKDLRALGLQQVREQAKGAAATKRFAALLSELAPDVQAALLGALADRGDAAARPAVLEMLKSSDGRVRAAAIHAMGPLGATEDTALLIHSLAGAAGPEKAAARDSLVRLSGDPVSQAIAAALAQVPPATRAELIAILATRRATIALPSLLVAAEDPDSGVRTAAMAALAELAGPDQVAGMVKGVLKAKAGAERDAAERAVMTVCFRIDDPNKRAEPLLAAMAKLTPDENTPLLSTLGRVGGTAALKIVNAAIADENPRRHAAGIRALCNWPDATVAAQIEGMVPPARDPDERTQLVRALIRVAALHDKRTDAERLAVLKRAMTLATTDEERNLVVKRCRTIRTVESLRYLVPYLEQPPFAQEACASVVELAHHKEVRVPNEAEFDRALDTVIRIGKDPDVVDHAQRYKKGET